VIAGRRVDTWRAPRRRSLISSWTVSEEHTRQDRPSRPSLRHAAAEPDFGPRYRVLDAIGKGGMGEVYRAYDAELKVEVALKIVRGDVGGDEALARFRREIALARKVTSPNVLRVYDLAEHDGLRFLSMELVDGEDLGALMRRDAKLPLARVLKLFRQVCVGLDAAHAEGVVHRDLKPQNVLVDKDDRVRVADFGLARSIGDSGMTASGAQLGSPAYMSPEQVRGDVVDERSDIYSLGIMLYQLVGRQTPFQADTPHGVMEMRLHKQPRPLRELDATVPAYLEAIVARCLELDASKRYATIRELLKDLDAGETEIVDRAPPPRSRRSKRLIAVAGAVALAAIVVVVVVVVARPGGKSEPAPSVVTPARASFDPSAQVIVLITGIQNRTGYPIFDSTLDLLLSSALRRSEHVDPYATTELHALVDDLAPDGTIDDRVATALAAREQAPVAIARGALIAQGTKFSLSFTLASSDGKPVLQRTVDHVDRDQLVQTIGQLALEIRTALGEKLATGEPPTTDLSANLEADHEYAVALGMSENVDASATDHLQRAIALDPAFADAHRKLAVLYSNVSEPKRARDQNVLATQLVEGRGRRDRLTIEADAAAAQGNFARAISLYEELLNVWPRDRIAYINLLVAYTVSHNSERTAKVAQNALRHYPHDITFRSQLVMDQLLTGHLDDATATAYELLARFPNPDASFYNNLYVAEYLLGHRQKALDVLAKSTALDPNTGNAEAIDLAIADGKIAEAEKRLRDELARDLATGHTEWADVNNSILAELAVRRGDKPAALAFAAKVGTTASALYVAAMVELQAGDVAHARAIRDRLARETVPDSRAYGSVIEAEDARLHGKPQDAMRIARDAAVISDVWVAHLALAHAAIDANDFGTARDELAICTTRRAEIALGFGDQSGTSAHYLPVLRYYEGRIQEASGDRAAAKASYEAFVAAQRDATADPLIVDAKRRLATP